jgi:thiamine pyrophosphokinase
VSPDLLAAAEAAGARVARHPEAKDATDLELALDEAVALGARRVLVVASGDGRLDHLAASLLLLGSRRYAGLTLDGLVGDAVVHVVRHVRVIPGERGALLTLLPVGGPATGVVTDGLEYPLAGERSSRARAGASRTSSWGARRGSRRSVSSSRSAPEPRRPGDAREAGRTSPGAAATRRGAGCRRSRLRR